MIFLPIVARELRVASRRRSTYWVRTVAGLVVLAIAAWFFLIMEKEAPRELPLVLFGILTGCAVLFCLLSGVQTTADCLSREKREGTLGLLFLTDLKGYDVVLGKLAASSINAFYSALAVVPLLAVPLLLGGVTLGEFGRMAAVAINTLLFSLSIGMCMSALCQDARKAMGLTFLVIVVLTALLPAVGGVLAFSGKWPQLTAALFVPSPGFSYAMAFDQTFSGGKKGFFWSMAIVHVLSWVFLGLASLYAPYSWQDRPAGAQRLRWRERIRAWSFGSPEERQAFRRQLLDVNAFFWLSARSRLKPAMVWALLALLGLGWAWGAWKFRRDWLSDGIFVTTGLILNLLIKGWFAAECGRQIADDRQQGALELLLSTPITMQDVLRGQRLALQRQFLGPTLLVILIQLLFMFVTKSEIISEQQRGFWMCLWGASILMLVADLLALFWVGLWQGLAARNPNRAATASLARILVVPWIAYALVMLLVALTSFTGASDPGWQFFLGTWFLLGIVADVGFGLAARQNLLTEFRQVASRRYLPQTSFWKRFFNSGP